ncbi:OLC1v1020389C1 [Oldenlandia corymbosa var. corymbosa]|uniref:OLC1v1020389C1 n=1 Tax=Oldenlandia corymbosa var. corymbosa TaxID=529605 RepID=A0AAV1EGG6_OLDCO|nr:OLC1v1020389C1 [Oldenlandia corymbosa var. corymbosa]
MSGVWVFKNGVVRLVENSGGDSQGGSSGGRRKVLVHVPSGEIIASYGDLERKLTALGWERYYDDPNLLQFHKRSTVLLISLPKDFNKFRSMHMYDVVIKNRNEFEVRDMSTNLN